MREREHIDLEWRDLPRGIFGAWIPRGPRATIVLATRLSRRSRRCILAHEFAHDERGIATTALPTRLRAKEERAVDLEVARRLVPVHELGPWVERMVGAGDAVTVEIVADTWDVDRFVAARALEFLASERWLTSSIAVLLARSTQLDGR